MVNTATLTLNSFFKVTIMTYFIQVNCELVNFLFVLLDKINMFTLENVYFSHQLLNLLVRISFTKSIFCVKGYMSFQLTIVYFEALLT
jgi:hypothetical protein